MLLLVMVCDLPSIQTRIYSTVTDFARFLGISTCKMKRISMSHLSKRRMMLNLYAKFFGFTTTQAEQLVGCLNHGDVAMGLCETTKRDIRTYGMQ